MFRSFLVAVAAVLALPGAALAHVTVNPTEAPAGSFAGVSFRVPHGCEESSTTSLSVQIPAGVTFVTPEAVPGWKVTTKEGTLPEPVETEGETITEGVTEVTWTGGPLPNHEFTDFGLSLRTPDRAGETLWFPAVQRCEQGETRWIKIPVEGQPEPDTPAPGVTLVAAGGDEEPVAAQAEEADDDDNRTTLALGLGAAGLIAGLEALGVALFRKPRVT